MRSLDHYNQEADDTLRRGMRDDGGLVHAAHKVTAEHVHAGWWVPACNTTSFRKHENRERWTEDPTSCIRCAVASTNARRYR